MTDEFCNKVIIVTGASSGIGKEITLSLLQKGAMIVACSRDGNRLRRVLTSTSVRNGDLLCIPCDVSRSDDVKKLISNSMQRFGKIDCLVNNAGQFPSTPFLDLSEQEWDQVIDTNLKGSFLCSRAVAKTMIAKDVKGKIVNISSTASLIARPGIAHYAASKAGLNMLTKVLAIELAPYGIRVNAVLPGVIATEGVHSQLKDDASKVEHQAKLRRIPAGHEGTPRDISNAVLYLISESSNYSTGALFVVDGGYSLGIPEYRL